jgi:hypothetical protein
MDPNTKLILNELHKGFSDSDLNWEQRLLDLEKRHDKRVGRLESTVAAFDEWKPQIEAFMEDIKIEVGKLSRHWDRSVHDPTFVNPGLIPNPKSATERLPASDAFANGPNGHCYDTVHREDGFRLVFVQTHLPVKGTCHSTSLPPPGSNSRSIDFFCG